MVNSYCYPVVFLLWLMIHLSQYHKGYCVATLMCKKPELEALRKFKQNAEEFANHLPLWLGEDCCKWPGVGCDNVTGHVIKLNPYTENLHKFEPPPQLYSKKVESRLISSGLLRLKHLNYLDLSKMRFTGIQIPDFIGSMKMLRHLDLSEAGFEGEVPSEIGNLTNLEVLNLSCESSGRFLSAKSLEWASGLRRLSSFDMTYCDLSQATDTMQVLNRLPCLSEIRVSETSLSKIHLSNLFTSNSTSLSSLRVLDLSNNNFNFPLPPMLGNLSSLEYLDLSRSSFTSTVPLSLRNIEGLQFLYLENNDGLGLVDGGIWGIIGCHLKVLKLSHSNIQGKILEPSLNVSSCAGYDLEFLDLSYNWINGSLPSLLGQFKNLQELDLRHNLLTEIHPEFLGESSKIRIVDISFNTIRGIVSHIGNLSELSYLDMSNNNITLNLSSDWRPPFQLETLLMVSCKISTPPNWLHTQTRIQDLDLSDTGITGELAKWIKNMTNLRNLRLPNNFLTGPLPQEFMSPKLEDFDIHDNSLTGTIPAWLGYLENAWHIDLSANHFSGSIPHTLGHNCTTLLRLILSRNNLNGPIPSSISNYTRLGTLDLGENRLVGGIPNWVGEKLHNLDILRLQSNQLGAQNGEIINGNIPASLCQITNLLVLDLQNNMLVGEIPDCWNNSWIMIVNLSSNKLTGVIPPSLVSMNSLMYLHLNDNKITGRIPSSITYLTSLRTLDLGGNEITGEIPIWPSHDEVREFGILRLTGNKLNGSIPLELCSLSTLYVLDLSNNQLTGKIPPCLGNISGFNNPGQDYGYGGTPAIVSTLLENSINESITGIAREYNTILRYLSVIDVSNNNFIGGIPNELTNLSGLLALNLSHNHLTGKIPYNICNMKALETLDLSRNELFGRIPTNLGKLDFINHLNVSYNNLSGPIPTSRHLETLDDPSIYAGNPYLCGDPLPKKCWSHANNPDKPDNENKENKHEKIWFDLVVMLGFATGFWGVIATLLLKTSLRHSLFRLVEDVLRTSCM